MPMQLKDDERRKIYEELKYDFINKVPFRTGSTSETLLKKMGEYFYDFCDSYMDALHIMCETMYKENNIRNKIEIFLMIDNKRNHTLEDDEIILAKKWLNGEDIREGLRTVYFRMAFDEENIEEFINETLGY